jgi:hypothetical protein
VEVIGRSNRKGARRSEGPVRHIFQIVQVKRVDLGPDVNRQQRDKISTIRLEKMFLIKSDRG